MVHNDEPPCWAGGNADSSLCSFDSERAQTTDISQFPVNLKGGTRTDLKPVKLLHHDCDPRALCPSCSDVGVANHPKTFR